LLPESYGSLPPDLMNNITCGLTSWRDWSHLWLMSDMELE